MTYAELEGSPKAVFDHPDQPGPQPTKVEKRDSLLFPFDQLCCQYMCMMVKRKNIKH